MSDYLAGRVEAFIKKERLIIWEGLHLVALSGGADSVALLLVLKQLGCHIEAVHCNFHLRGEESDRDESFVKNLCSEQDIKLHLIHFDTNEYAAVHQVSIEMAARELRYRYFEQLRQDIGAETICVAHHRNDAVETLLMNLMRGAGIHGLTGIHPKNGAIVRPLLCVSRDEIEDYLHARGQAYVTDSTNLQPDVLRNKIRLQLLPLVEEIYAGATENIAFDQRSQHAQHAFGIISILFKCKVDARSILHCFLAEIARCPKVQPRSILYRHFFTYHIITPYNNVSL